MNKENLVVLRGDKALEFEGEAMYPNQYYRCLKATENDREEYFVYGIKFDKATFDTNFEFAYDRIMRDWELIGLTKGGKLIGKTAFKVLANVHTYGKQSNNLRIIFFGFPNECMYGFYPIYNENKAKQLDAMYKWCIQIMDVYTGYFEQENIQFGQKGIPLSYGDLRVI
jgi:hypothetical protein